MPKWSEVSGGIYIYIAEAIEVESKQFDDIRVFHHARDKIVLAAVKRWVALAVYDLICGDVLSARQAMDNTFHYLDKIVGEHSRELYFIDVMQEIDRACEKKLKHLETR